MTKRQTLMANIRFAGHHNDQSKFMRLYTENRISYQAAIEEFRNGAKLRENGMRCTCFECAKSE